MSSLEKERVCVYDVLVGSSQGEFLGKASLGVNMNHISLPRQQVEGGKHWKAVFQTSPGLSWHGEGRVGW